MERKARPGSFQKIKKKKSRFVCFTLHLNYKFLKIKHLRVNKFYVKMQTPEIVYFCPENIFKGNCSENNNTNLFSIQNPTWNIEKNVYIFF